MFRTAKKLDGYMTDQRGRLVPIDAVKEIDKARDELVMEIVENAKVLQKKMVDFKAMAMGDISAFVELSAERYGVTLGGRKGNTTLVSFDGRYQVKVAVSDRLVFDEGIQAAKALVDQCVHEWTKGSRTEIKALIEHAFQTDKEGKINVGRIFSLLRLEIDDERWQRAMDAIRESMQIASTTTYLRIYERVGDTDRYRQITLDLAAL